MGFTRREGRSLETVLTFSEDCAVSLEVEA